MMKVKYAGWIKKENRRLAVVTENNDVLVFFVPFLSFIKQENAKRYTGEYFNKNVAKFCEPLAWYEALFYGIQII